MERLKKENGITMISLIIFVIIMIILAGSVIFICFKNNGIFSYVNDTKKGLSIAEEKDKLDVAVRNAKTDYYMEYQEKLVTKDYLQKSLDEGVGKDKTVVTEKNIEENEETENLAEQKSDLEVKFVDSGRIYVVDEEGTIKE